jgi:hypothetical protein
MTTPGKLHVDTTDGRIHGPATITYNSPFPCVNGTPHVTGAIRGVVMHTMVGNLPGTIAHFNNPDAQASAHFGISQAGEIHQFGPLGKGWKAWAQADGNMQWYSIEHADDGDQHHPLTQAQITASAQVVECLSAFAGFPLRVEDDVHGKGYGTHVMGGAAWGGHTCPGPGPRAGQRLDIVQLARIIRAGAQPLPKRVPQLETIVTDGTTSLHDLAAARGTHSMHVLYLTSDHFRGFPQETANWGNRLFNPDTAFFAALSMPAGLHLRVPVIPS